jgi:cytochrome c biogenesis protein CcdA
MNVLLEILSFLAGFSLGGMTTVAAAVFVAKVLHRDRLAKRIARSVAKVTWALQIGGGQSDYSSARAN